MFELKPWHIAVGGGMLFLLASRKAVASLPPYTPTPPPRPRVTSGNAGPFMPTIRRAVARHVELQTSGGSPLLTALIDQESRFDPLAESPTGAAGLGQFTGIGRAEVRRLMTLQDPNYASRYIGDSQISAKLANFSRQDAFVPELAIEAAALYLASLLRQWRYNVEAALTAYNAGGVAAGIVARRGSHTAAVDDLRNLPENQRSQSVTYAPEVLARHARYSDDPAVAGFPGAGLLGGNYVWVAA